MAIKSLRTPDQAFENLPDWPYTPHYIDDLDGYQGLRVHYIDEGPRDADRIFLCLHGQPTWSYLYRKMIPVFVDAGARVVAPDWLGFGRSDKPVDEAVYGYNFHRDMMMAFIKRLDLRNITLVVQDWGGVLGLTLPHAMPDRIKRLLIMNTALATGRSAGKGFEDWRAYCRANPDLNVAGLMKRSTPIMTDAEAAAYGAPFPDTLYKAGVRRFPEMVMTDPDMEGVDHSLDAAQFFKTQWQGSAFMAVGMQDPVLGPPIMNAMQKLIRGCSDPYEVQEAGHFVQEWGGEVARAALEYWDKT